MRTLKSSSLVLLAALAGCSALPSKTHLAEAEGPARHIAQADDILNNRLSMKARMDSLMDGIFQGYMMGQVYLQDYDHALDTNPENAMKTDAYASLLAIRSMVEEYEHQLNEFYVKMVIVSADPKYTNEQRQNARIALDSIGKFVNGIRSDNKKISENLKPMILMNLRDKQTELYDVLKAHRDQSEGETKEIIHREMVKLRATRMAFYQDMSKYKVDKVMLSQALKEEKKKTTFKKFEADLKDMSQKMKDFMSTTGRDTNNDSITPSAGKSGNVTGDNWPERTWSLTYDDGPHHKNSLPILKELQATNTPATFFMCAGKVKENPSTALKIKESGIDIANHSYTHALLTKVTPEKLEYEIGASKKFIEEKLDTKVKLFRLPYGGGNNNPGIRSKIAQHGMIHVAWNVDTLDWQDKNPQSIFNRAVKHMQTTKNKSGVILFHDIHERTLIASRLVLDYIQKQKLTTCSVQSVIDQINQNLPSCK